LRRNKMSSDEIEMLIDLLDFDTVPDEYKRLIERIMIKSIFDYNDCVSLILNSIILGIILRKEK